MESVLNQNPLTSCKLYYPLNTALGAIGEYK